MIHLFRSFRKNLGENEIGMKGQEGEYLNNFFSFFTSALEKVTFHQDGDRWWKTDLLLKIPNE